MLTFSYATPTPCSTNLFVSSILETTTSSILLDVSKLVFIPTKESLASTTESRTLLLTLARPSKETLTASKESDTVSIPVLKELFKVTVLSSKPFKSSELELTTSERELTEPDTVRVVSTTEEIESLISFNILLASKATLAL